MRRLWSADGEIIEEAAPGPDEMGGWEVRLDFTSEGAKIFADLTNDIAQMADPSTGALGRLAIVLDGQLESAPTVRERIGRGRQFYGICESLFPAWVCAFRLPVD